MNINKIFPHGILRPELFMGKVASVGPYAVYVDISEAMAPSGFYYKGERYGKGEVGEFVLIEGQISLVFGRIVEVKKDVVNKNYGDAISKIQLLGSLCMDTIRATIGVEPYPRLGDMVYSAPHKLVSMIPELMTLTQNDSIAIEVGTVDVAQESVVKVNPETLFGRHLAILGTTGGGKSWTTAKILEESIRYNSKIILIDATGEYRNLNSADVSHCHLGDPIRIADNSIKVILPPITFQESDFLALFEPAGKTQGPKLKEAIKSLRLAKLKPDIFHDGYIKKINQNKSIFNEALSDPHSQAIINNPTSPFDVEKLPTQIEQECVYPNGYNDPSKWGKESGEYAHCISLITRINSILSDSTFESVFTTENHALLTSKIDEFIDSNLKLLRIDLSGISFEYNAREIISNAIGRIFLTKARASKFISKPLIIFLDEAHHFLGKRIGSEDTIAQLDAFELIAKEGRKFGLNICLATQRPRDITEDVLSQIGTMIVHRLTNDRDREVVERACGEIDRSTSAFLPNLKPGEAVIIGTNFPIPLTIQITQPKIPPESLGPNYQTSWHG